MLAERSEQYRRLAERRDGRAVIGQSGAIQFPSTSIGFASPSSMPLGDLNSSSQPLSNPIEHGFAGEPNPAAGESSVSGTLVQVYSSRSNSPPFALTDNTGRTVAYVTPAPGVNLRVHLNSEVQVTGGQGYVTGLNTPHIVAAAVARTIE